MNARIVFMGSPEFALATLRTLAENYLIAGVVTQPDKPAGRGQALPPPPIKVLADELGLPVIQPRRLRQPEAMEQLRLWQPDLIVVAAFGQILRPDVLDLPPYGCVNVHASLLPCWRGAAPIQAAILNGDPLAGVTIMKMEAGIDTGAMISQGAIPIRPQETAGELSQRLAQLGAELLIRTLPDYLAGTAPSIPQDNSQATLAPMLKKEDGRLDFTQPAEKLAYRVRAFNPWPSAYTEWQGQLLKIHLAHSVSPSLSGQPGARAIHEGLPAIHTADGLLVLDEVQPAGKKSMPGKVFLQGARNWC